MLRRLPLKDWVAAISVGVVGGEVLLDLDYAEDSNADVDMNVIMTGSGRLVELQATGETRAFTKSELDQLIAAAQPAIQQLVALQRSVVGLDLTGE
jgi:ribonuclease PH